MNDFDDLSGAQELALGELVAEKFGSDFFFLDRFPTQIRPFYTMPCPDDERYILPNDFLVRRSMSSTAYCFLSAADKIKMYAF